MRCYDEGALRAYLDDALPTAERAAIDAHLSGCVRCRAQLEQQHALAGQVGRLLAAPAAMSDPQLALKRLRAATDDRRSPTAADSRNTQYATHNTNHASRRNTMQTNAHPWFGARRGLFASLAAIVELMSLLALPPVRAAANQLLQLFRVQKVMFVPISQERIEQLKKLNFDGQTLFVDKPKVISQPAEPRTVASADAAAGAVGFPVAQPTVFPSAPTGTEHVVHDRTTMQFKVNVEAARQLMSLLNVDSVTLPDSLGTQPITADVPAFVETRYRGAGYGLTLYQGRSPTVTLPDGVDLAQLGKAGLELLGMDEDQAEAMSKQIDWNNTLIFPFPSNIRDIRQIQVGDAEGLLIGGGQNDQRWQLYWQSGDRFSMLEGRGRITDAEIIAAAESVR